MRQFRCLGQSVATSGVVTAGWLNHAHVGNGYLELDIQS